VIKMDPPVVFECKSREQRLVNKKLNSTETLIQRTTMEAPQKIMPWNYLNRIGAGLHWLPQCDGFGPI
jgi:hypothetical protein